MLTHHKHTDIAKRSYMWWFAHCQHFSFTCSLVSQNKHLKLNWLCLLSFMLLFFRVAWLFYLMVTLVVSPLVCIRGRVVHWNSLTLDFITQGTDKRRKAECFVFFFTPLSFQPSFQSPIPLSVSHLGKLWRGSKGCRGQEGVKLV